MFALHVSQPFLRHRECNIMKLRLEGCFFFSLVATFQTQKLSNRNDTSSGHIRCRYV